MERVGRCGRGGSGGGGEKDVEDQDEEEDKEEKEEKGKEKGCVIVADGSTYLTFHCQIVIFLRKRSPPGLFVRP